MSVKRKRRIIGLGMFLISLSFAVQAHANLPVSRLVILKDSPMFNSSSLSGEPAGIVSGPQQVNVKETLPKTDEGDIEWFLVETWLGDKWIPASDKVATGNFETLDRDISLVQDTRLYDLQQSFEPTERMLPPQKVRVLGRFTTFNYKAHNVTSVGLSQHTWYRIETSYGSKWIAEPFIPENVKAASVSFDAVLAEPAAVFPYPTQLKEQQETLPAGTVHVNGLWGPGNRPLDQSVWLNISLPQGDRWLLWNRDIPLKATLLTETRLFTEPYDKAAEIGWLPPGTYDITANSGEWSCIETDSGRVWLRTARAPLEKPLNIQTVTDLVELTDQTITYRFPIKDEVKHPAGYYAPQKVTSSGKWISGTGEIWYRFDGADGEEWVQGS